MLQEGKHIISIISMIINCKNIDYLHFSYSDKKKQSQLSFRDDSSSQMGGELSHASMNGGRRNKKIQNLPLIDLGTIKHATNNFCSENKLGEGGFGVVYKVMIFPKYRSILNIS